jgi:cyclic-di-GMP phosphodiesterase TipF (flagellum assembly factor)
VQGLVYLFIALAALGVAAAAYFGLTFTPIEAAVTAIAFGCLAILLVERQLRRRAEGRLEKAI